MTLTEKIKKDYGTVKRFCIVNNININTFKQVSYGLGKSNRIFNILKSHKYIKNSSELERKAV